MKKIYIIGFFVVFVFILILFIVDSFITKNQNSSSQQGPSATKTPARTPLSPLSVISMTPANNASVPLDQQIVIVFNRIATLNDFSINVYPNINTSASINNNSVTFSPVSQLQNNIIYKVTIFDNAGSILLQRTFSTGSNPIIPFTTDTPNTGPTASEIQRETHPDVFLSNNTPYQTKDFSINSSFQSAPQGHYAFSVTLLNQYAKPLFLNWLHSLGLTDAEIQTLDITYQ